MKKYIKLVRKQLSLKENNYLNLCILLLIFLFLLIRLKYQLSVFETDTGQHAYAAQELLRGFPPYQTYHLNKPPGVVIVQALTFKFLAESSYAVNVVATFAMLTSAYYLYKICIKLFSKPWAVTALAIFLLSTSLPFVQSISANSEVLMLPLLIASAYYAFDKELRFRALAGTLIGISLIFKLTAISNAAAIFVWIIYVYRQKAIKQAAVFAMGALVPVAIMLIVFKFQGVLDDFILSGFIFNFGTYFGIPIYVRLLIFPVWVFIENMTIWILGILGFIWVIKKRADDRLLLVSFMVIIPLIVIQNLGKGYGHYYMQIVPFLTILSVYALQQLVKMKVFTNIKYLIMGSISLSLFILISYAVFTPVNRLNELARPGERGLWYDTSPIVAEEIMKYAKPGDYIYNLGREGQLYFYTQTRSPSRYLNDRTFYPLPETIEVTCRDLAKNKPVVVVDTLTYPYFPDDLGEELWKKLNSCGNYEIAKKEKVLFAEIWLLK